MGLMPQFDSAWALGKIIDPKQIWRGGTSVWSCQVAVADELHAADITNAGLLGDPDPGVRYALYGRYCNAQYGCIEIERATPVVELAGLIDQTSGDPVADSVVDLLPSFHALIDTIIQPELRIFVRDALRLPTIRNGFCCAPASRRNHHAFAGGLLHHSVEAAEFVLGAAAITDSLEPWERDLGLIVALFHDIGKLASHRELDKSICRNLQHEAASLSVLQPALETLEAALPEYAQYIHHHLWGHRETNGDSGWLRLCLQFADHASACHNNEAIARMEGFRNGDHLILRSDGPQRTFFSPQLPEVLA